MSHRSMIRRVILAAAALIVLPAGALAQTSRVEGMALQGDYIKDYTGIYTYTSGLCCVGNLVYGELGNILTNSTGAPVTLDRGVGAVLGNLWDGRYGVFSVHLREETPALGQGDNYASPNPGAGGYDPNVHTNESFDVMWGQKFGTTSLGLRLNRSYYRWKSELPGVATNLEFDNGAADGNVARNVWGFGGGVGFEMNANTNVELSLLYQSRTFENSTDPGASYTDDASGTYQVAARAMWQWMPDVMVVPVFKYYSFDLSTKSTPTGGTPVTAENSLKGWQAGLAGNWTIGNNDLFVLGVTFAQNTVEQESAVFGFGSYGYTGSADLKATETLAPQVFAALETHVNNWLTIRMGAQKGAFNKLKIEDNATGGPNVEISESPFSMNIGCGVKLGTLQLDAIMSDFFPHTLGWLGSGVSGVYFPKVTATYSF